MSADLPDGTTAVRIRYSTDPAVNEFGVLVDDVKIDGASIGTAETDTEGWTLAGFTRTNGVEVNSYYNAYIVENRQYDDYDESFRTAYNFGYLGTSRPDWVETHPYQDGALIWYLNDEFNGGGDFSNDVADHPGEGFLLPVDAHPQFTHWPDGTLMRNRILSADSTFGYEKTQAVTLHNGGVAGHPAVVQGPARVRRHRTVVVQRRRARCDRGTPGPLPAGLVQRRRAQDGHDHQGGQAGLPQRHPRHHRVAGRLAPPISNSSIPGASSAAAGGALGPSRGRLCRSGHHHPRP